MDLRFLVQLGIIGFTFFMLINASAVPIRSSISGAGVRSEAQ